MAKTPDAPSKPRYHHGDLRNAFIEAAVSLVAEHGVQAFSLREAAREVGVSPAAVYRHFEDKEALLAAVAAEGFGRLATAMERAITRTPGEPGSAARAVAAFGAMGEAYVEFAVRQPARFRVMFGPWCPHQDQAELPPEVAPLGRDPFQILLDALDELVAAGAVPAAARPGAEVAAWSMVHGLAGLVVDGALPLGPAERAGATGLLCRTLLAGLGCPPALLSPAAPVEADPRPPAARKARRN